MEKYSGYLFSHFVSDSAKEGEQIYFSLSEDGIHWSDLNNGKPVLISEIGEKGVRDPFMIRCNEDGETVFRIIATDLRIASGKGWHAAQFEGSKDIIIWESKDLVNWVGPKAKTLGVEGAGCVWAPEAIYDKNEKKYLVFWASMVKKEGADAPKQIIYASYTRDFDSFEKPFIFLEKENHVIDSTIIFADGFYYRYTKDETTKNIVVDRSKDLDPNNFIPVDSVTLDNIFGVEGPEIFKINGSDKWCLIVDRFATHKGYLPMLTVDLSAGKFLVLEEHEFDMGQTVKRHGGVIAVTEEEMKRLREKY